MPTPDDPGRRTRRLRTLVEPIAAVVFFAPEAQAAYVRLGFPPPRGAENCIPLFDWGAYFVSRAACLGQVRGEVLGPLLERRGLRRKRDRLARSELCIRPLEVLQ